jgi:hypothetical protein
VNGAAHFLLEVGRHRLDVVILPRMLGGLHHDLLLVLPFNHFVAAWHQVAAAHFFRHPLPPIAAGYHGDALLSTRRSNVFAALHLDLIGFVSRPLLERRALNKNVFWHAA